MSSDKSILHTICLRTVDAQKVDEERAAYTFRMPDGIPTRPKPIRVSLASCEFPMAQWTIEEEWSTLYVGEGWRPQEGDAVRVEAIPSTRNDPLLLELRLPPPLAEVTWKAEPGHAGWTLVTCDRDHNLWTADRRPLFRSWARLCGGGEGGPRLVAGPIGRCCLSDAEEGEVRFVDARRFAIRSARLGGAEAGAGGEGALLVPPLPSPSALCDLLTYASPSSGSGVGVRASYDAPSNRVQMSVLSRELTHRVEVLRTPLLDRLGVGSPPPRLVAPGDAVHLPSESLRWGWLPVSLRPGWYGPCSRSSCPGPPRRLTAEVEASMNRLVFHPPERVQRGDATSYFVVFVDPCGATHRASVPPGRYDARTFCAHVSAGMSSAAAETAPGCAFRLSHSRGRFRFQCWMPGGNGGGADSAARPAAFSLLFNHPMQFDPERLGFEATLYAGSASYSSPFACTCPPLRNTYRAEEVAAQGRLRLHATPPPPMLGRIVSYRASTSVLTLRTHVGQLPCAHGLVAGDAVCLARCGQDVTSLLAPRGGGGGGGGGDGDADSPAEGEAGGGGGGEWSETRAAACDLAAVWEQMGVVVETEAKDEEGTACTLLHLRTRRAPQLATCVGKVLLLLPRVSPFSLCCDASSSLPSAVPSRLLGLRAGATQWGKDGSVPADVGGGGVPLLLPPYLCPRAHAMDHPDYVLIYLEEGKQTPLLQHSTGGSTTLPLTKLVLYPSFREERSIPRETTLLSGEGMTSLTIRFANPDGSAYRFHGSEFSFSLNLLRVE